MRILPFICLALGSCLAAPSEDPSLTITGKFLKNDYVIYTAEHDIVKIFAPINQFPLKEYNLLADEWEFPQDDSSENDKPCPKYTVFFIEADVNNKERTYKGLYVSKNGQVAKLLDNGRDAVANNENVVYFGATDGIYKYNDAANTAEKHGDVTDNIIQLAFNKATNTIYYLTANHEVYKLNTEATASVKVPAVKDAQAIVVGYDGKLYYYDSKKDVYVFDVNSKEPVNVTGLPDNIDEIVLISPVVVLEQGVNVIVDKTVYLIRQDGTSRQSLVSVELGATAYEPRPTLIQFLAKDKKLYQLDAGAVLKSNVDKVPAGLSRLVDALPTLSNCKKD